MKKNIPSRLKLTYVFSYILVFIVPFSIMSYIFYYNSVKSLREETELSHTHNLSIVKNMVDNHIKELNKIGALISYDNKLSQYMVNINDIRPEAITELNKYKENSSIIDELYLHYYKENDIFSSVGYMSTDTFLTYQTNLQESDQSSFITQLREVDYSQLTIKKGVFGSHPIFMYPLPPGPAKSQGIVFIKLSDTFFGDMINTILGSYEGTVYIFDQNDEVIATYSNNDDSFLDISLIQNSINNESNISELRIDNVNHSIMNVYSESNNWTYVTALPTKQFFNKVYQFKNFMLLIVALIVLIASISAIYLALKQYHPIERMLETAKKRDIAFQFSGKNELDNLRISIETMYEKHENLKVRFVKQEPLIRDQCLTMLLQGQNKASEKLSNSLHLNLNLNETYSFVFVTSLSKELLSNINMEKLELATSELLKNAKIYTVELINDKLMTYIINGQSNNTKEKKEFLVLFMRLLQGIEPTALIGVGESYNGNEHIHRSFIEASAAYEYGRSNEEKGISYFKDIKGPQETLWLPKDLLLKLTQSYKQGNAEIANESIISLIIWVRDSNTSIHLAKHMQYDIMNTIIKTVNEIDVNFNLEKIYYLKNITSLEQLEENLLAFTTEICTVISNRKEKQKKQLQFDILIHIKDHFKNHDFSLENMAQKFNLSASYLSRYIKEETHMTFSQYVWELRLEVVKRHLIETDSPIKDIVTNVGYIDAPNFTRKFKNSVGLTPGQYRNLYMKDS